MGAILEIKAAILGILSLQITIYQDDSEAGEFLKKKYDLSGLL